MRPNCIVRTAGTPSPREDISPYFSNRFTVVKSIHRVNVHLTQGMLRQLDERGARLNISQQAVIKTLLDQALQETGRAKAPRKNRQAGRPRL